MPVPLPVVGERAALAGVIAMRPKLIILDEPTSLLDPKTALEVVSLIERLNHDLGITFIVVEHRLELLIPIADRLVPVEPTNPAVTNTTTEKALH